MEPAVDANPVVAHREYPFVPLALRIDMDARHPVAAVLERVADEILEDLGQLIGVGGDRRQAAPGDLASTLFEIRTQVGQSPLDRGRGFGLFKRLGLGLEAREPQQTLHQGLHVPGVLDDEAQPLFPALVELISVVFLEELAEAGDAAQRRLEVVGS